MVICEKYRICKHRKGCGGTVAHERCEECGQCPMDKTAKCVELNTPCEGENVTIVSGEASNRAME